MEIVLIVVLLAVLVAVVIVGRSIQSGLRPQATEPAPVGYAGRPSGFCRMR